MCQESSGVWHHPEHVLWSWFAPHHSAAFRRFLAERSGGTVYAEDAELVTRGGCVGQAESNYDPECRVDRMCVWYIVGSAERLQLGAGGGGIAEENHLSPTCLRPLARCGLFPRLPRTRGSRRPTELHGKGVPDRLRGGVSPRPCGG